MDRSDLDIWNPDDEQAQEILNGLQTQVRNIRRDEMEGVVLPDGYKLELLSTGGSRQFDTNAIINRYDNRIAMTVLADFIFLGHEQNGSWALSSDKTELFSMACGAFLILSAKHSTAGNPGFVVINGEHFKGITDYPKMTLGEY